MSVEEGYNGLRKKGWPLCGEVCRTCATRKEETESSDCGNREASRQTKEIETDRQTKAAEGRQSAWDRTSASLCWLTGNATMLTAWHDFSVENRHNRQRNHSGTIDSTCPSEENTRKANDGRRPAGTGYTSRCSRSKLIWIGGGGRFRKAGDELRGRYSRDGHSSTSMPDEPIRPDREVPHHTRRLPQALVGSVRHARDRSRIALPRIGRNPALPIWQKSPNLVA